MKLLFGIYKPDYGKIKVFDSEVRFESPHDAIDKKIGMVHQHFMLIEDFTVLENVILGNELTKGVGIDYSVIRNMLNDLIEKYNLGLNVDDKISELGIGAQQKVEILKLLYRSSEIMIFDEPTAVLSPAEVEEFLKIVREFKLNGKTIIFITHKLNEVKMISDRVSVLRRGKLVYEVENTESDIDIQKLSRAIVGEAGILEANKKSNVISEDEEILRLKNVSFTRNNVSLLNGLDLQLKKGEILGICGVEGNGQSEIVDIIIGLEKSFTGEFMSHTDKISHVPDDRIKKGMISELTIGENIFLKEENELFATREKIDKAAEKIISEYDVRVPGKSVPLGSLSGGNQQKVIVAREINLNNDILIFSHPSRGVDINATLFIHSKIIEVRNSGKAVLLISSDLDELVSLSDRLGVLYKGKIIRTFEAHEINVTAESEFKLEMDNSAVRPLYEQLGKLMIGIYQ
jgi:simple sugar transport system ATP-binding protein